ncbi:MAG: phenylalanine--tRNA ligase subunit beta, partial [Candidatus Cloacimonas sp.]|nr:phenylalanine--tRNA ligase subunit beta [Candidatus Cloacimonas sp.]
MNISINWLSKYLELTETAKELEQLLTFAGIEVEAVHTMPALPHTIISAKVIKAEAVPKTDHLRSCLVDIGSYHYPEKTEEGYLQVICGAPNCHAGMMALIALPGTQLPDFTISKAKIRGIESHGMLCSEKELGISENHAGIIELPADTALGISPNALYALPDTVFELEITPNRPDLLGYIGIARDLSAKLNRPVKLPDLSIPDATFACEEQPLKLVNLEHDLCPRYIARVFRNIHLGESPLWLKSALIKSGLRPINNLVDITNYVMLEYGHPLHAFDYSTLAPQANDTIPAIVIRKAEAKEAFTALDGKSYTLDGDELVIADGVKASALAGVMGGAQSAIGKDTTKIVLESAAFDPGSIRKTSYKHKLSTDSSYRFERHLSDHSPADASLRATQLICELAGAELGEKAYGSWPKHSNTLILGIRPDRYAQVIGYPLSDEKIKDYLDKLGLTFVQYGTWKPGIIADINEIVCHHGEQIKQGITEFTEEPDCVHSLYFEIPTCRVDLEREIDLIEELARLDGYERVPVKTAPQRIMDRHAYRLRKLIADYAVNRGCYETLNYSFSEPALMAKLGYQKSSPEQQMIRLVNPQSSNMSAMRTTLIPQLLQNLAYNLNHGERNIKLFELGKVYLKKGATHTEPFR